VLHSCEHSSCHHIKVQNVLSLWYIWNIHCDMIPIQSGGKCDFFKSSRSQLWFSLKWANPENWGRSNFCPHVCIQENLLYVYFEVHNTVQSRSATLPSLKSSTTETYSDSINLCCMLVCLTVDWTDLSHIECNSAHETPTWHNFSSFVTVSESLWHLSWPGYYFPSMRKWDNYTALIFYMSISPIEITQAIVPNTGYPYVSVTK
jgi:hypothetical protein